AELALELYTPHQQVGVRLLHALLELLELQVVLELVDSLLVAAQPRLDQLVFDPQEIFGLRELDALECVSVRRRHAGAGARVPTVASGWCAFTGARRQAVTDLA